MKQLVIAASALMILIGAPAFAQTTASPAPPASTGAENPGGSATAGPTGISNRNGGTAPNGGTCNDWESSAMVPLQAAPSGSNSGTGRSADCPQGTTSNQTASNQSQSRCANPSLTPGTTGTENKPVMDH